MKLIILMLFWSIAVEAKDLGTHGATFEIVERDLLEVLQEKLQRLEASGAIAKHQGTLVDRAKDHLMHPKPVGGIHGAKEHRLFTYDPTFVVPYDLKDHEGRVFQAKGTKINPLEHVSLRQPLVFIDGRQEGQIKWLEQQKELLEKAKIILVAGSPFDLMETWQKQVYFDQGGVLTQKLGIQAVPALVRQRGLVLEIEEIPVLISTEKGRVV
jgi:conjugal transfer pilus assembly protein TraW